MAPRPIVLWPDPRLQEICAPVDPAEDNSALIRDMFDTMYAAKGRGLAAPQVGVLTRLFVVDVAWKEGTLSPRVFLNPEILETSRAEETVEEQCLSIPDLPMPVARPDAVSLRWSDERGKPQEATFQGPLARCILHEFDHLNGRLILDHQSPAARATLEACYAP